MRHPVVPVMLAMVFALVTTATGQEEPSGGQNTAQHQSMTPEQRAASTRALLGLGPEPDKAAAARGAPLYQKNCAFCHGPQARGATGPSLITSDEVLNDDHGERLTPFLQKGRPESGMPAFATLPLDQLRDISEFLHLQVEEVANRGTYHVLNIVVGNAPKGQAYVAARCMSCHTGDTFAHIGSKFRSAEQLQHEWIWPTRAGSSTRAATATVKTLDGATITGRATQISDFRITLVDSAGQTRVVNLEPGAEVQIKDPLAAHQEMIMTLTNDDMHNVTAYLATLK
ncbi:c-type cytochrome [Alloacidobacterium dinghuense]|uniref:C-type cytochrome n=1 Tax=Alloacidobacterium dinghuense TaxID=2763107 RepID=A0A7G8BPE9_9BACT|nr:c-type cytochrome [Alloacidobacterium dinghuense]QNI34419.1 c-type cytochrome [Alloacidobacterium dinghuense]